MNEKTADEDMNRLKKAAAELGEHFDSVQIFATRHEPALTTGTIAAHHGVGSYYARYGQVREWVLRCDERTRLEEHKDDDV